MFVISCDHNWYLVLRQGRKTLARRDDPIDTICQEVQFLAGSRCVEERSALHLLGDTSPEPGRKLSLAGYNASEIFLFMLLSEYISSVHHQKFPLLYMFYTTGETFYVPLHLTTDIGVDYRLSSPKMQPVSGLNWVCNQFTAN